ncbi:MAG: hypothetical protein R3F43_04335 [bacterium]
MTGGRSAWLAAWLAIRAMGCEEGAPPEGAVVDAGRVAGGAQEDARVVDMARPDAVIADAAPPRDAAPPAPDQGADASTCEPVSETCNGEDDDCDGRVDEDIAAMPCYDGPAGTENVGRCRAEHHLPGRDADGVPGAEHCPAGLDECGDGQDEATATARRTRPARAATRRDAAVRQRGEACTAGEQQCSSGQFRACEERRPGRRDLQRRRRRLRQLGH